MGFGTIITSVLMFIILMFAFVNVFAMNRDYMENNNVATRDLNDRLSSSGGAKITIAGIVHNSTANVTSMNISNEGRVQLGTSYLSVYIDKKRIAMSNVTAAVFITDPINPGLWDPDERIIINATKNLSVGDHMVTVFTDNKVSHSKILTVT